jgi:tetratricopeptide (TPR) repeat protein
MRFDALFLSLALSAVSVPTTAPTQQNLTETREQTALHQSPDWALISPHLPNPATASAEQLETAGDILNARRFPEDALDYYSYALQRGADKERLMKKEGVVRLQIQEGEAARALFKRCVGMNKNDAEAWNDLAATDFSLNRFSSAISEYKRAVKLNKESAIFHANLGTAYFSNHDIDSARNQFAIAVRLDPRVMEHEHGGSTTLHMLQSASYATMCYEIAKMYFSKGDSEDAKRWLLQAGDHGFDLRAALNADADMHAWLKDPDVQLQLQNSERLHKQLAAGKLPPLGARGPASAQN